MPTSRIRLTSPERAFLADQRVGRLASVSPDGTPHVVPVCYALGSTRLYIALDTKPKRVEPLRLRRVQNILEHPQVALVVDRYSEDWATLAYVLIHGRAELLPIELPEHRLAIEWLRIRYPQYLAMPIEHQPVIAIEPQAIVAWGLAIQD